MFTPSSNVSVRKRGKWLDVLTVKRERPLGVIVLGVEPVVVDIHFVGRSYLCSSNDACPMCDAGVGRQSMMFVAVWCKQSIALVRLSYRQDVVDTLTLGWSGEISIKKVGASYSFEKWKDQDVEGRSVTAGQILQRVMILHKLEPSGEQLVSAEMMWDANYDKIRCRAAYGAQQFVAKSRKHVG